LFLILFGTWEGVMDNITGLLDLTTWGYVLVTLLLTQVTIVSVTVYLHRAQAHHSLVVGDKLALFFRTWLWLTTGMITKEWVAIHRKHHAKCEMLEDPHSPIVWLEEVTSRWKRFFLMIWFVMFAGVRMYVHESRIPETMERFGAGTPDDWFEKNIFTRFPKLGVSIMLVLDLILFGAIPGFLIWIVQMAWIPIFAAGVINGVGHFWGYRNFENAHRRTGVVDASKNFLPWGIFIGGEELHNNHHAFELSPKFSVRWFEFDIGWVWIQIFDFFGLIKSIRRDRIGTYEE